MISYAYGGAVGAASSRPASRWGSRKGSKKGSRVNLLTPLGIRTPGEEDPPGSNDRGAGGYFNSTGVDFVDEDVLASELGEEEDLDAEESELRRLVWGRVGGWVDWAVGWMDWRDGLEGVMEENEDVEDAVEAEGAEDGTKEPLGEEPDRKDGNQERKKKRRREVIRAETAALDAGKDWTVLASKGGEEASILGDVGWLLGAARRALI